MKSNLLLDSELIHYLDYAVIVEGKKDVAALEALGFTHIYPIHQISVPIRVRVEQISQEVGKKKPISILTDFDRKGKQLYLLLKKLFQEHGAHLDGSLRDLMLKHRVSHIEGIEHFVNRSGKN